MLTSGLVPALPSNAVTESNRETLVRLRSDLQWIDNDLLSAAEAYRMYWHDERGHPLWGYLVESAQVASTKRIFVLMRSNDRCTRAAVLRWMPMEKVYTKKQALLLYRAVDVGGPAEDTVYEILKLLQEAFEYAVEDRWSYSQRLEFYRVFPFEELTTKREVEAFRPVLFSYSIFSVPELQIPASE